MMWTQTQQSVSPLRGKIPEILILDNRYTRTFSADDSFIANIRRALPVEIPVDLFEGGIASKVGFHDYEFLCKYYEKGEGQHGQAYLLKSIPHRLSAERTDQYPGGREFSDEDREFLFRFYRLDEQTGTYNLVVEPSEVDEIRVLRIFHMRNLHIDSVQKAMISEILERVDELPAQNVFYATMHVPEHHRFYSPPNLKHISGMQIIEAARQFGIACHHIYGGVPVDGVTFMLESLGCEFFQYAKMNYPLKFRAVMKDLKLDREKAWRNTRLEVTAYQHNIPINRVSLQATILPLKVYRKLRAGQEEDRDMDPRFTLNERCHSSICIRYREGEEIRRWDCQIGNISKGGFLVRHGSELPPGVSKDPSAEFFMHFAQAGFVHGYCRKSWDRIGEDGVCHAGFAITDMTPMDRESLGTAIARFGHLVEGREIC